jgi:hypothetical protein
MGSRTTLDVVVTKKISPLSLSESKLIFSFCGLVSKEFLDQLNISYLLKKVTVETVIRFLLKVLGQ